MNIYICKGFHFCQYDIANYHKHVAYIVEMFDWLKNRGRTHFTRGPFSNLFIITRIL